MAAELAVTGRKEGGVRRVDPEAAARMMRSAGFTPVEPYHSLATPWRCRCEQCKRPVAVKLANIQRGFTNCPECLKMARIKVMRDAGAKPLIPYPGAREPWLCQCTRCLARIEPSYDNVRRGQGACRFCVGQGPVTDERARQEMIAVGVDPLEPYPGDVHAPWRCRCLACGAPITPSRANALRQHPCKHCSKTAAGVKIRVCSAEEANQILADAGLESQEPYPGTLLSHWPVGCRSCSWRGVVQLHYLRQGNRPVCPCVPARPSGFDGGRSALLYVLRHHDHAAGKIGVMNEGTPRLDQHRSTGWAVVTTRWFDEGWKAVAVERAVLDQLRSEGSAPFLAAGLMPYGGHTETFDLRQRSVASVERMISAGAARFASANPPIVRHLYIRSQSQPTFSEDRALAHGSFGQEQGLRVVLQPGQVDL